MSVRERFGEIQRDPRRQYNRRQLEEKWQRDEGFYMEQLRYARITQSVLFDQLAENGVIAMVQRLTGERVPLLRPTLVDKLLGRDALNSSERTILPIVSSDWAVSYPLPTLEEMREEDVKCKIVLKKPVTEGRLPFAQYDEVTISYGGKLRILSIAGAWNEYPPVDVFTGPDEAVEAIRTAIDRAFDSPNRVPQP